MHQNWDVTLAHCESAPTNAMAVLLLPDPDLCRINLH